jgi:hypothetical protein
MKLNDLPLPHRCALVHETATGLIRNTLLAMLREPEEARSGIEDVETLVRSVSRLDPPRLKLSCTGAHDCRHHALACVLATDALRRMLSAGV